jgi:hypothetical protein
MPYVLRKMPNQDCYRVYNRKTKRVFAKCSTLERAKKQIRLLNAIEYGNFVPRRRGTARRTRSNKRG